jgi:DNA-binding MarR family transcriptional regulator
MSDRYNELHEAWGAFFVAHALAIRKIEETLGGETPLTLDEYDIMLGISRAAGGRIRYSTLADATVFTRSGITRVIRRLEERGFVDREACEVDKRGAFAVLTPAGKLAMKETWRLYSKAIIDLLEPCFNRSEARQLAGLLERLIERSSGTPLVQISARPGKKCL